MSEFERVWYDFIYTKNKEEIIIRQDAKNDYIELFNIKELGTCFCSILNCKDEISKFKNDFNNYIKKYSKKLTIFNTTKEITETFTKLFKINNYLCITKNSFDSITAEARYLDDDDFFRFFIDCTNSILEGILEQITFFENFYFGEKIPTNFIIPSFLFDGYNDDTDAPFFSYTYTINTIYELLSVSCYLIMMDKLHLKRCKLCGKYFVTSRGQTRFCNNQCPTNPNETCRSVRKTQELDSFDQESWEIEIDNLKPAVYASRQFFADKIKRTNNQREKNMLLHNKKKYASIINELGTIIKGSSEKDRNTYLNIYKDFVNDVRNNQKNHNPPILVVKKPKYKGFKN